MGCNWRKKTTDHGTTDQQKQFNKLLEVTDKHHLVQMIEEPTREENTLDLIFTNNPEIITQLDISKTIMSDHNIIEVTTNIKDCNELTSNNEETIEIIKEMPWTELFDGKNNEECSNIFIYFIKIICFWKIPKGRNKNKITYPKKKK